MTETSKKASASNDLERKILDPNIAKNESEWWARERILKLEKQLAKSQKQAHMLREAIQAWADSTVREELIAAEKGLVVALFTTRNNGADMKFYTDLKGTVEAKPGDLIALAVSEYGGMLHQQEVSKRPRLSSDGKRAVFDWKDGEGGPFMVSLEE